MPQAAELTPMLRQYLELKQRHTDAILLYRMGDFYEMFFEDAIQAAPILEVLLTARHKGTENEAPMCGVPHHAVEGYIGKLLRAGLKVAICDQVEDPAVAKGLVRREVTRVVTPGTVSEPALLDGKEESLLAALVWDGDRGAGAFLDVSTGGFFVRRWRAPEEAVEDLRLWRPREALYEPDRLPPPLAAWIASSCPCGTPLPEARRLEARDAADLLRRQFGAATLRGFGLDGAEPAVRAAAAALAYAQETQHSSLSHVRGLTLREPGDALLLDATTLANLEVFGQPRDGARRGGLVAVLDRTVSPPGGRLLRDWLRRPLRDPAAIARRHDAVGELVADTARRERLRQRLARVGDLERLLGRAVLGTLQPREAAALRDGLREAPGLREELAGAEAALLIELAAADPAAELADELGRVLTLAPPAALDDGGVIAEGVDAELDHCRSLARDSKRHILALEGRERERTGIASLKIRYNKVFGYYLEITKANQGRVPADYVRKQTLVNAERYVTPEIKDLEERILTAEGRQLALEAEHFARLRERVAADGERLTRLGRALAALDALAAFAEAAARGGYVRPRVTAAGGPIVIRDGRHPVLERAASEPFVPNDTELDGEGAQIVVLTGPNMGGKSTYLRQVALIVLMAQAGSFVPAAAAEIGAVDRIFTRVGASDDLARGESTFMVEMIETANILRHATPESLVILDEVGRGTATFDGLSLAWAIVEHLHEHGRPKTLFATHYHELTELAALLPRVVNRTMAVREWQDKIVFLRRVVPGSADKSYGLQVARLAGIPGPVIERAAEVLANLESQEYDLAGRPRLARGSAPAGVATAQMPLFTPPEEIVAAVVRDVDLERLSPLAALNLLHSLKSRLGESSR
ncbi:MAG TPA: DNA mismatch repair protein MutS [Thermoanaerobaculia bacterium]|nr:DNA mismatch repair protein MutS [Thermoanaerobaculia bacterium]